MPVPDELDWDAAGGVPEVFTTAHDALFTQAQLLVGERLLVHGAAGGVGMAAVQLGTMAGARVTATVRDEHCREQIDTLGVKAIAPEDFPAEGPYDVILELVGAPNMPANLGALAQGGRICVIGIGAGAKAEIDLRLLMGARGRIHASTLRARSLEDKAATARLVEKNVLPGFVSGDLSVFVAATYPLAAVAEAYERFQAGASSGRSCCRCRCDPLRRVALHRTGFAGWSSTRCRRRARGCRARPPRRRGSCTGRGRRTRAPAPARAR